MVLVAGSLRPNRFAGPIFISPILCCIQESGTFRMHPSSTSGAPVAYSSTGDVAGTYRAGILGGRPWIRMYVARHQKEQELCLVRTQHSTSNGQSTY